MSKRVPIFDTVSYNYLEDSLLYVTDGYVEYICNNCQLIKAVLCNYKQQYPTILGCYSCYTIGLGSTSPDYTMLPIKQRDCVE